MMLRIELSGKFDRAQQFVLKGNTDALEFVFEETVIEANVVSAQYRITQSFR